MADGFTLTFHAQGSNGQEPGRSVAAVAGETVIEAARRAGFEVVATCGARGRCRSCQVKVLRGAAPPASIMDQVQLGPEAVRERFRLSCQMPVTGDMEILLAPPRTEAGHKVLGIERAGDPAALQLDSGVEKHCVRVLLPDDENHQSSDVEELLRVLPVPVTRPVPVEVLRRLPEALREADCVVTATVFDGELIAVQPGDRTARKLGMAFDIGTTSIVGSLLDLDSGEELAAVGGINPQAPYGGDLMSRIAYVQEDARRLQTLRAKVLGAVNGQIAEACGMAGVEPQDIHKLVVVGNACMHHIFLGMNPTWLGLAPYAPSARDAMVLPGRDVPLKSVPDARVCLLPLIAGFVGADTVAAALATRIYESDRMRCLVDIGTNGEVVMGRRGRLLACSAPAGPALEGGQIRHGMRGAVGAIERVGIGEDVTLRVIGDAPPVGICGSGMIDALAAMLDAGVLDRRGLIRADLRESFPPGLRERLRTTGGRDEFVLCTAAGSGGTGDITLNQSDIRQLQLAKGAICSGVMLLQSVLELATGDIAEIYLCGGFGTYISASSAVRMRLLPEVPPERITYFGNAAGMGAQMALLSETERARAAALAREIEHVSLATHPDFQRIFMEALSFPSPAPAGAAAQPGTDAARPAGDLTESPADRISAARP